MEGPAVSFPRQEASSLIKAQIAICFVMMCDASIGTFVAKPKKRLVRSRNEGLSLARWSDWSASRRPVFSCLDMPLSIAA